MSKISVINRNDNAFCNFLQRMSKEYRKLYHSATSTPSSECQSLVDVLSTKLNNVIFIFKMNLQKHFEGLENKSLFDHPLLSVDIRLFMVYVTTLSVP
jgi:hypothetical protein